MQEVFGYRTRRQAVKTGICVFCGVEQFAAEMIETGPVYRVVQTEDGPVHIDTGEQYYACAVCAKIESDANAADRANGIFDRRDLEDELGFSMGSW